MAKIEKPLKNQEARKEKLHSANREFYENFLENLEKNYTPNSIKQYSTAVLKFLEYFNRIPVRQIEQKDLEEYISLLNDQPAQLVNTIRYLKPFLTLIPSPKFNIQLLEDIANKKQVEIKSKLPLGLEDVIKFRNKLTIDGDYKAIFVFELLYVHGVKWKDFEKINKSDYSFSQGELKLKSGRRIILNNHLRAILDSHQELLTPKSYNILSAYLNDACKDFERTITETEIKETRNKYFPTCQICGDQYPNTAEYWALVESKDDVYNEKWIVCISCAHKSAGG